MKTLLSGVLAAALFASPVLAGPDHDHDDDVKRDVKQTYNFADFDKIEVVGVYKLDIRQGDSFAVRTEATKKDAKWMEVRQDGDTLILGAKEDERKKKSRKNKGVYATVTMPKLSDLEVAGIATGQISAFSGGDVSVEIAGISDLTLTGTCDHLDVELAGMGSLDAHDLKCVDVEATLGGMGDLEVFASNSVDATVGGMGSIDVHGDPKDVSTDKSMFSSINIR